MRPTPLVLGGSEPADPLRPRADLGGWIGFTTDDASSLPDFMRGAESATGARVNMVSALANTAVFRSVSLISYAIGMLPLQLINEETKEKASGHPLYRLLHREPNSWQTAFDFRALMQMRVLVKGNAYALIVRTGPRVVALQPMDPDRVTPFMRSDMTLAYKYQPASGARQIFEPGEILHLRGLSLDGISGLSLVQQAREAIGLALAAERATARMYRNGMMVGGALTHPGKLSGEAFDRLKRSMDDRRGADNAGKDLILEEGLKYEAMAANAKDAQSLETRKLQIEEVARIFGVPRPLLMVDDTSWGSGIEQLGRFFVSYGLSPQFEIWQQAIERALLTSAEKDTLAVKFNPGALLRGSLADQASFFSKALGAGGQQPFMTANEVRGLLDMPAHDDGDSLTNPMTASAADPKDPADDADAKPPGAHLRRVV